MCSSNFIFDVDLGERFVNVIFMLLLNLPSQSWITDISLHKYVQISACKLYMIGANGVIVVWT